MIKVQILTQCKHCDGEAYLPVGETESYTGEAYMRYEPCPQCQDSGKQTIWVTLAEFVELLETVKCQHEHISSRGGFHFALATSGMTS